MNISFLYNNEIPIELLNSILTIYYDILIFPDKQNQLCQYGNIIHKNEIC